MKYIKTFEELNIETYLSASKELRELGFENRADKLLNHAYERLFEDFVKDIEYKFENEAHIFIKDNNIIARQKSYYNNLLFYQTELNIFEETLNMDIHRLKRILPYSLEKHFNIPHNTLKLIYPTIELP